MNERGLVSQERGDLLGSVSTLDGCGALYLATPREGRTVVKLLRAQERERVGDTVCSVVTYIM